MNTYFQIFESPVFDAIGSALLHSLWQGAAVAGLLFFAFQVVRKEASELRYALSCAALIVMIVVPIATAIQLYMANPGPAYTEALRTEVTKAGMPQDKQRTTDPMIPFMGDGSVASTPPVSNPPVGRSARSNTPFPWRPVVVTVWFGGIFLMALKWGNGAITARRLRKSGMPVYQKEVEAVFHTIKHRLGIEKVVGLQSSLHIDQPMMIGWLKPVVLLPVSVLTAMPLEQVEAILAHELAHVRRHDYFILMLQTAAETLFFYHPAVWWVSKQMNVEREYCCDRLATDLIGNDLVYASALANLAQAGNTTGAHVLGASDGRLVDRIRRIVDRNRQAGRIRQRPFSGWGAGLVTTGCMLLLAACLHGVAEQEADAMDMSSSSVQLVGSPEELYREAIKALETQDIVTARDFAEEAANEGHMCSCLLLFHIYDPDKMSHYRKGGVYKEAIKWGQESDSMQVHWGSRFSKALKREAESGNNLAMLWLNIGYKPDRRSLLFTGLEQSDSLANVWYNRALEANNPHAWRLKAEATMQAGNVEEADALFLKAAELGDEAAFMKWTYADTARVVQPDPNRYFMIADLAIKHNAPGTRGWLGETISTLEEQVDLGNDYAMQWLIIAESLNIPERLKALSETPRPHWMPEFLTLCQWEKDAYFTWFYEPK